MKSLTSNIEMLKLLIVVSFIVIAVYTAPPGWPTAEQARADLLASGLSEQATDGILKLATDFASQKPAEGTEIDRDAARAAFNQFLGQVGTYVKTQSSVDQAAYNSFIAKKKSEFEARIAARKADQ